MSSKVWLITGCSSGFGRELASTALSRGYKVIATARNPQKIQDLKDAGADILALDVTASLEELKKIAADAHGLYGRIDFLVNNAGYSMVGGLEEFTPEETQQQFDTNVFGLLNVTRAFLPYMRKAHSGVIANVSSVGGWMGFAGAGLYCASKWAVTGLSETLYFEVKEFGIKVCTIEPGYFRSNFLEASSMRVAQNKMEDYEGSEIRKGFEMLEAYNNKQPGDPKKGANVIVDVLTEKNGKEIPFRLVLGSDAVDLIQKKCSDTVAIVDEWKDVSRSTDFDK